jgi:iron complex transport system substrate-binding protein
MTDKGWTRIVQALASRGRWLAAALMLATAAGSASAATFTDSAPTAGRDCWRTTPHRLAALRVRLAAVPAERRRHVYYAREPDGLTTAAAASLVGEFLPLAGALDVAQGGAGLTRASPTQIAAWNPDVLVVLDPGVRRRIVGDPAWAALRARRQGKVLLAPHAPFGWIDEPPGVNRLLGLQWLAARLYPGGEDIRDVARDFCSRYYRIDLTEAQVDRLLAPGP